MAILSLTFSSTSSTFLTLKVALIVTPTPLTFGRVNVSDVAVPAEGVTEASDTPLVSISIKFNEVVALKFSPVIVASSPGYPSAGSIEVITGVGTTVSSTSFVSSSQENITRTDNEIIDKILKYLFSIIFLLFSLSIELTMLVYF